MATISYLFPPEPADIDERERRDTKAVGDRSELEVMGALIRNGYRIALPFGENHRYDLIADDGERLFRVQVKTGRLRNGVVQVKCYSTHAHRRRPGEYTMRDYLGEIDFLAAYCPQNKKVYLIPEKELARSTIHLRIDRPVNGYMKVRWASRYELA